ncbi:hypothetical protein sos41_22810 [Alphaproteobacteria bacterium SO-S41]|nr:hypothetical protein sos41_22810 [Alphaproteobacteria bacterium SO-S41]
MNWKLGAGIALALTAFAPPAMAKDEIGKSPVVIKAAPSDQMAESVYAVVELDKAAEDTHLFATSGGDPAANGLYLFMQVMSEDKMEESPTFWIGDFNSWEVAEQTNDYIILKINRAYTEDASGNILSKDETWKVPMVKSSAKELTVTIEK